MAPYRRTTGTRGSHMLTRDLVDGRAEIMTLRFWECREVISGSPATTSPGRSSIPRTSAT
jgi:hypothetical protein